MPKTSRRLRPLLAGGNLHLCDNYLHLLFAVADAANADSFTSRPLILFLDDRLPLSDDLRAALAQISGAELTVISDRTTVDEFARLPARFPGVLRRNVSWPDRRPTRPSGWTPDFLSGRHFSTGFVYHPGFFVSKVAAGHCDRIVMRDSGYANYVRHPVPPGQWVLRLLSRQPPRWQTWGEESWIDAIEVAQPDRLPARARCKATRQTLDDVMERLPPDTALAIAAAFWGEHPAPDNVAGRRALLLTQPIDELGMCSTNAKCELYENIADRLRSKGFGIVVKPHPREQYPPLPDAIHLPASFPIEAWTWLGQPTFDLAISLNSTSLVDRETSLASSTLQLVEPEQFYPEHFPAWQASIDERLASLESPKAADGSSDAPQNGDGS